MNEWIRATIMLGLCIFLILCAASGYAAAFIDQKNKAFAEDMARGQAQVSGKLADANKSLAEANNMCMQVNADLSRWQIEQARSQTLLATVGTISLTIATLIALVLIFIVVSEYRKRQAERKAQ